MWKSALMQLLAVAVFSIVLAILLPKSFFESWGWLSGPMAWILCSMITASILKLRRVEVLLGAILAGIPSVIAVVLGVHWLGALLATLFFALWCGYRFGPRPSSDSAITDS